MSVCGDVTLRKQTCFQGDEETFPPCIALPRPSHPHVIMGRWITSLVASGTSTGSDTLQTSLPPGCFSAKLVGYMGRVQRVRERKRIRYKEARVVGKPE